LIDPRAITGRLGGSASRSVDPKDERAALKALRELRAARRRRYRDELDWIDGLYRIYLAAIAGAVAVALISGALTDARVDAQTVGDIASHAPALLGLLVAVGIAAGLRSGARGGPLALEAPEVQHVLLAPIDRATALRGLAFRRLRTAMFVGAIVGVIAGNFAFRRLPGKPAEWLFLAGVFGAMVPLWTLASAMVASGRRLRQSVATIAGLAIIGWSLADLLLNVTTSPASMLGELAVWPVHKAGDSVALPVAGAAAVLLTAYAGVASLGGISLEAALRRASLAAELRFAVTIQDIRAVILLRRQLASEAPRRRPWTALSASFLGRRPIPRRGLQSFLRWPAVRVARVCVLGAAAGVALCGAWQGTTPLVIVAAAAILIAAFDAVEPLAQEVDHPTRRDLLPMAPDRLIRTHLLAPIGLVAGVGLVAVATAALVGAPDPALEVGAVMLLPSALLVLCCAALSATNDPYAYILAPALGYAQSAAPMVLALVGIGGPVLAAREAARRGYSAAGAAAGTEFVMVGLSVAIVWWLGRRIAARRPVKT
jgi:hypothetical protein